MGSVVMGRSSGVSSRYRAMELALDWRFFPLSRTSLGLPVLPEVVSSNASSGCTSGPRPPAHSSAQSRSSSAGPAWGSSSRAWAGRSRGTRKNAGR